MEGMVDNLVSVIMPVYNAADTVGAALRSVFLQADVDWEIIVVDDGSTDDTVKVVEGVCSGFNDRVKIIKKENGGAAEARNTAIKAASGEYLAFLDADDLWYEGKLSAQIEALKENGAALAYGSCRVIDKNGEPTGVVRYVPESLTFNKALYGNQMPCSTVVIDRKKLRQEPVFYNIGHEDYALWLLILRGDFSGGDRQTAVGIKKTIAGYREASGSLSSNKLRAAQWTYRIYKDCLKLPLYRRIIYFFAYAFRAVGKRL